MWLHSTCKGLLCLNLQFLSFLGFAAYLRVCVFVDLFPSTLTSKVASRLSTRAVIQSVVLLRKDSTVLIHVHAISVLLNHPSYDPNEQVTLNRLDWFVKAPAARCAPVDPVRRKPASTK